ncbi:hypothetical protein MTR67_013508, partial [Solanum verrucosum]
VTLLPHLTHSLDRTKNLLHSTTVTSFADQMAEGGNASRYVKLTKDQAPREDIKPGELNQPIDVPQVLFFLSSVCILSKSCCRLM